MSLRILRAHIKRMMMAGVFPLILILGTVFFGPVMPAAAQSTLPEPVASSPECEWMGEMRTRQDSYTSNINGAITSLNDSTYDVHFVTAPVPNQTCGTQWYSKYSSDYHLFAYNTCTADPYDMNTQVVTERAEGTGVGTLTNDIRNSGKYPDSFYLYYLGQATTGITRVTTQSNSHCGPNQTSSFTWRPVVANGCDNFNYIETGYLISPNAEASVGSCVYRNSTSQPGASESRSYIEFNWRLRKVNCNYSVDSDNGGRSDCDEYADKTNPADGLDDINVDTTAPIITVTTPTDGGSVILGSAHTVDYSCADESDGSGLASCSSDVVNGSALDTSTVGAKSFTISATDNAGNTSNKTVTYNVRYQNTGFLGSVDGNILNKAKAGATIPVQFKLVDANGTPISTPSSFVSLTSAGTTCTAGEPADAIEQYTGNSGLQYLGDGVWQYNWKTAKTYAGQCRVISLNLADGSSATAKFQF